MAKALYGFVGAASDARLAAELASLRQRISDLEGEVTRLRAMNSALAASVEMHDDMLTLAVPETAEALA